MKSFSFEEFKPSIFFLLKFLGLYVIGNVVYGIFIEVWYPGVDPLTAWVTHQSSFCLNLLGWDTQVLEKGYKATANVLYNGRTVLAVYEGCNGVNVMIIYIAFLFAFGPYVKKMWWFIPSGLMVVHLFNLLRIILLFFVTLQMPRFLYFTHKYLFTAILYIAVFFMWVVWIRLTKPANVRPA